MRQSEAIGGRGVVARVFGHFAKGPTVRPSVARRTRRFVESRPEPLEGRVLLAVTPVTAGKVWATLGSDPVSAVAVGGTTYFTAGSPAGFGLYKTDGSEAGTPLVHSFGSNAFALPQNLTAVGDTLYFTAADAAHGTELWKSDGTDAGTVLVKDVRPGTSSSLTKNLVDVAGTLFFTANDGVVGDELWKSDGTDAGTVLVANLAAGTGNITLGQSSEPTVVNGVLFFRGSAPTPPGQFGNAGALYRSDGTAAGTFRVTDPITSQYPDDFTPVGNTLFFRQGNEVWKTDGTLAGTTRVKPGTYGESLTELNGSLLFVSSDAAGGWELWTSDGAAAGTARFKDINPGAANSLPNSLTRTDKYVFFLANDGQGQSLWRTDGTADGTIKLPATNVSQLMSGGGRAYFVSTDPAAGAELWTSDGTPSGTVRTADVNPGPGGSAPTPLARAGGTLYFSADDSYHGRELFKTDGTDAGTALVEDVNATPDPGGAANLTTFRGEVYFAAPGGLYKTNGAAGNAVRVAPVTPKQFAILGDALYFTEASASAGLWKTDGTAAGTSLIQTFPLPAPYVSTVSNLTVFKGNLYFSTRTGVQTDFVIWKSDGTTAGTVPLQPGATWPALASDPRSLTPVGDTMYFYGYDGSSGVELWKTDGSAAGTKRVADIYAGGLGSMGPFIDPPVLVGVNGKLVFGANTSESGYEPWVSDGTEAGTQMLRDLWTEPRYGGLRSGPFTAGGLGWFFGAGTNGSLSLFKTDGTPAGTVQVKVLSAEPAGVAADFGGKLLFFTRPSTVSNDYNLWVSDGTEAGTRMIRALRAPTANAGDGPGAFTVSGGLAYFAAADTVDGTGRELWQTDGTTAGTQPVVDLKPGADGSAPADLLDVSGTLYFAAVDAGNARQIFKATIPTAPPAAPTDLVATAASPFRVNLTWRGADDDEGGFRIERSTSASFSNIDTTYIAASNSSAFTDDLAEPGIAYYYRVSAFNVAGRSAPAAANVTTPQVSRPVYGAVDPTHEYYIPFDPNAPPNVPPLVAYRSRVYFRGYTYENGGFDARSDGETITPLPPGTGFVPTEAAGTQFYVYNDGLWRTDGVPGDAVLLHQFNGLQGPGTLVPFGNLLLFAATDGRGIEPWVSDGSVAGTHVLKDVNPAGANIGSYPEGFTVAGNTAYFYADDGAHGYEPWKTDGTEAGTVLLKDIQAGSPGSLDNTSSGFQGEMQAVGDTLYFRAFGPGSRPGVNVYALFKTDGTEAGTTVVASNRMPREMTPVGDKIYFLSDATNGYGLYVTDGTPAGTQLVKFVPATRFYPRGLTPAGGRMFFEDGVNLWVSDGTAAGTRTLHNFGAQNDPTISGLTAVADRLYFRGGEKLWTSDGSTGGTVRVPDPTSGLIPGAPRQLVNVGEVLFFTAKEQNVVDRPERLWRLAPTLPAAPVAPSNVAATVIAADEVDVTWADNSTNETGFLVERSATATFDSIDWSTLAPARATRAVDRTVVRDATYYYRVRAFNAGGRSDAAVSGSVTIPAVPNSPTGLMATAVDASSVNLHWTDASGDETAFVVERSTRSNFAELDKSVTLPAGSTDYADSGLTRLTTYYYRVAAVNDAGRSGSATASVTTPEAPPAAPSDLTAFPVSGSEIDLQWRDNSDNETNFVVERADGGGPFVQVAELPAGRTYFGDTGWSGGSGIYRYRVRAGNVAGPSAYSPEASATALPPEMVTPVVRLPDLPTLDLTTDANPSEVVVVGNTGFFLAMNEAASTGKELWKTDGTVAGTSLVKALDTAASPSSLVNNLTGAGGLFYFLRTDANAVTRLWRSDGTADGTFPIRDLFTNIEPRDPFANRFRVGRYAEQNGQLYFEVWELDQPRGVFRSDGTAAGTFATTDAVAWPDPATVTIGDAHYYGNTSGVYVRQGPPGGPEVALKTIPPGGQFMGITRVGDRVAFATQEWSDDVTIKYADVYITDGTQGGTVRLARLSNAGDLGIRDMEAVGGDMLYFAIGGEIWRSDLTPQGTVKLVNYGGITPHLSAVIGLMTYSNGQVWATDGTEDGTVRLTSIGTRSLPAHPDWFVTAGGKVYFASSRFEFDPFGWRVGGGQELYLTDGTAEGTVKIYAGDVRHPVDFNGTLYFVSTDKQGRDVIYKTDGSAAGTVPVKTFEQPVRLLRDAVLGDAMFFAVGYPFDTSIMALWKTDGTDAGTAQVTPQRMAMHYENGYGQEEYAVAGGRFFFAGESGDLYATDGTAGGTAQVAGVFNRPLQLTELSGTLYYNGKSPGTGGWWLYKVAPGATSATRVVKVTTYDDVGIGEMIAANGALYYTVPDFALGYEMWTSDGTAAGTHVVTDVRPGQDPYAMQDVFWLTDVGGTIFFLTREEQSPEGYLQSGGLYRTDGTAAGTVRIRDVTLDLHYVPTFATAVAGKFVFSDGDHLWRSDGTTAGTVQIDEIGTASDGSHSPAAFVGDAFAVVGDRIFYPGTVPGGGRDLRVASLTPPQAPSGLSVSGGSSGAAPAALVTRVMGPAPAATGTVLNWTDNSANETGFAVERSRTADFAALDAVYFVGAGVTQFADATAAPGTTYFYRVRAVNAGGGSNYSNRAGNASAVVARHIFYNHSGYDGDDAGAGAADDNAIAAGKAALLPGAAASFANVTSYFSGINGIMVDLLGLHGNPTADDFSFRVRNANGTWSAAPQPVSITRRGGAGEGGSDRITIIWADGIIANQWLEVTVKPTQRTGLTTADVFSFGNLVGETGNGGGAPRVGALDLAAVKRALNTNSVLTGAYDFNRDGRVNALDLALARRNLNRGLGLL